MSNSLYLSSIDLFLALSPSEVIQLSQQITTLLSRPGQLFYTPSDPGRVLFWLQKGRVQLYTLSPEGHHQPLAIIGPGAIFGPLIGHPYLAKTLDESLLGVLSWANLTHLLTYKPNLAQLLSPLQ